MNDPHVKTVRYRIVSGDNVDYDKAKPIDLEMEPGAHPNGHSIILAACSRIELELLYRLLGGYATVRVLVVASHRLRSFNAKASMFFSPERRKSRKSSPLYLHVSQMLSRIKYSRMPFAVLLPPMTFRSVAKAFTACSALLLFQGTSGILA